jgi:flagellin
MPQVINTNIPSINTQRHLDTSQAFQHEAFERLSSGLRINSAKDDAAGLSISTRFTSQTQGLEVAIRNANDGISLSQTAEGALGTMTANLQRIRELALQSANGTNSDADREALNAEAQQMVDEINRTAETTDFNGIILLDGTFSRDFQIGSNVGETLKITIGQVTTDVLGAALDAGVSANGGTILAESTTGGAVINGLVQDESANALGNGDLVVNGILIAPSSSADDEFSTAFSCGG